MAALPALDPSATLTNEPTSPPTLMTIAPEIRNRIYELALTTDEDVNLHDDDSDTYSWTTYDSDDEPIRTSYEGADTEMNLLEAEPPSKALLLTCRQIYQETKEIYREAYRKFWSETKFCVIVNDDSKPFRYEESLARFIRHAKAIDIPHIKNLRFRPNYPSHYWLADGLWYNGPYCNWKGRLLEPGHMTHWNAFASKPGMLGYARSTHNGGKYTYRFEAEGVEDTWERDCLTKDEVVMITRWYIDYS